MPAEYDPAAARELELYIVNESRLYDRSKYMFANLTRKKEKGTYKHALAVKLTRYLADEGAKMYCKEFGYGSKGFGPFSVPTRNAVAEEIASNFESEYASGQRWYYPGR